MRQIYRMVIVSAVLAASWRAQAWGPDGHQQVAAIAAALLKGSVAERQVAALLGPVPLSTAAVWADCAKGVRKDPDGKFTYNSDAATYPECVPFNSPEDKRRFENFVLANLTQCGHAKGTEYCHNQYHYTDISPFRAGYDRGYVGAKNWDVVQAINAALIALRDGPAATPPPFVFADRKEALMLLAHYIGDIHQPLHVTALYLGADGTPVDPDKSGYQATDDTNGGNYLLDVARTVPAQPPKTKKDYVPSLHSEWDGLPADWRGGPGASVRLLQRAALVTDTQGDWRGWSVQWANEVIMQAPRVFDGLRFSPAPVPPGASGLRRWRMDGTDDAYMLRMAQFGETQLARGGARLAQMLKTVWPEPALAPAPVAAGAAGYLVPQALPDIRQWLMPAPSRGSAAEAADIDAFKLGRTQIAEPRGMEAALDDVFDPVLIVGRFSDALGGSVSAQQAPTLMKLIGKMKTDAERLVHPVKLKVGAEAGGGGRERPLVSFPDEPTCLYPRDLAGHREDDLVKYKLKESGSYPSTHALVGMMVGLILSEVRADRGDALIARGLAFGDSRVVCGFHYPSDVAAGRVAAAVLFARLHDNADFLADMARVRSELAVSH